MGHDDIEPVSENVSASLGRQIPPALHCLLGSLNSLRSFSSSDFSNTGQDLTGRWIRYINSCSIMGINPMTIDEGLCL